MFFFLYRAAVRNISHNYIGVSFFVFFSNITRGSCTVRNSCHLETIWRFYILFAFITHLKPGKYAFLVGVMVILHSYISHLPLPNLKWVDIHFWSNSHILNEYRCRSLCLTFLWSPLINCDISCVQLRLALMVRRLKILCNLFAWVKYVSINCKSIFDEFAEPNNF